MTSYHDLEEKTYERIRAKPFTRIHGLVDWTSKEILKDEAQDAAMNCPVSYDWAGTFNLLVMIMGAPRYAAENPDLPPYVEPVHPPSNPTETLTGNPSATIVRNAIAANNLLRRDWSVVRGFRRGVNENIMDALDLEFFQGLRHSTYKFMKVLPRQFFTNLETKFCPLDVNARAKLKKRYFRGWDQGEQLVRFPLRLDEEQASLALDGIAIDDEDKYESYLREIYKSRVFSNEVVTEWNKKPLADQTYEKATPFFEAAKEDMDKIDRLMGNDKASNNGFSSANAAVEWGEEVKEIIQQAVVDAMAAKDTEHALAITSLREDNSRELQRVQTALDFLTERMKELSNKVTTNTNTNTNGDGGNKGGSNTIGGDEKENKNNNRDAKRNKTNFGTWTPTMKLNKDWNGNKVKWFKFHERVHKRSVDEALRKSDFAAWEAKKRADVEKMIHNGKTE